MLPYYCFSYKYNNMSKILVLYLLKKNFNMILDFGLMLTPPGPCIVQIGPN